MNFKWPTFSKTLTTFGAIQLREDSSGYSFALMSSSNLDIEWLRHVYELMDNSESARVSGVALLMRPGYCVATAGDLENCFLPDNTVEYKSNRNSFDSISAISKEAEELFKTSEDTFYCFGECSRVTEETLKAVRFQDKLYFPVKITECSYLAITKKRKEGIVLSSLSEGLLLVSHFKSPCVPNVVYHKVELFADKFRK